MLQRQSLSDIVAALRASYWFVPALLTTIAVGLCGGLIYLDHVHPRTPSGIEAFFLPTSVEGARALLSAIVSSTMTVVAVTFSVTVVALTVASQHYGPRLLNTFMRDRTVQVVLGLLIATFSYSVFVLGSVGTAEGRPLHWATGGAIVLVACSVIGLIVFVHHVTTALQVSSVVMQITRDCHEALRLEESQPRGPAALAAAARAEEAEGDEIHSRASGYIQRVDERAACRLAVGRDVAITVVRAPGKYLIPGAVIAAVTPTGRVDAAFARELSDMFLLGADRTTRNDLEFGIKQLVEIALRGLSPGVNEPFTAIACIDRIGEVLAAVAARDGAPAITLRDDAGTVRLVVPRQTFETLARAAFDPIRIFGGSNTAVYARLLDTFALLAETLTRREYRDVLQEEAQLVMSAAEGAVTLPFDVAFVRARFEKTMRALDQHQWRVGGAGERQQHG